MDLKKLGLADKMIFILGIIMGSFIMTILVLGIIVAVLKMYADGKRQSVQIRSVPAPDQPKEMLAAETSGQVPPGAGNRQHAPAVSETESERSIEANIMLLEADLRKPGELGTDARFEAIGKLAHAYRQAGRHQEADYCLRRLDRDKTADEA
ncbi:hypothetical protein PAESOLCIP111_06034 [Paenibacillus solanacearum]|uniref:Uncharacterized protein n=1 Tax=Paenibacillus solanacearum TaxID=2048548 RepID=A0A916K8T3_9BACL|nr:hypothetical protein [Paenibacillus solanacearum]CAG7650231.1 hypothetical protein PAESOLCIP111_06034 [Paenibacillus solanacearum]